MEGPRVGKETALGCPLPGAMWPWSPFSPNTSKGKDPCLSCWGRPAGRRVGWRLPHGPPTPSKNLSWLRKAGRGSWDPQSHRQTSNIVKLPSWGQRAHELHVTHACELWRKPPGSPQPGRLRSPPRRQPADGCHHPKFRAGWAGRALGPEGHREGGGQQVPGTARPAQSPVSPFREAGPPVTSLGFVFLTARLTGDCWLRAPARARLSGSCGHIWKMFGRAPAPCPPVAGLRAAADKRLLLAPAWAPGSCRLRPTALTSGAGRGGAEGTGASSQFQKSQSGRTHNVNTTDNLRGQLIVLPADACSSVLGPTMPTSSKLCDRPHGSQEGALKPVIAASS